MSAEKRVIFGQLGWWTRTKPCFQKYAVRADSEFYADMKQIFYFA